MNTEKPITKETPFETIIVLGKFAVLGLILGFCLHLGEYTAEQIWPTPPITLKIQDKN